MENGCGGTAFIEGRFSSACVGLCCCSNRSLEMEKTCGRDVVCLTEFLGIHRIVRIYCLP